MLFISSFLSTIDITEKELCFAVLYFLSGIVGAYINFFIDQEISATEYFKIAQKSVLKRFWFVFKWCAIGGIIALFFSPYYKLELRTALLCGFSWYAILQQWMPGKTDKTVFESTINGILEKARKESRKSFKGSFNES